MTRLTRAQVEAEVKTRLRSPATVVAVVAIFALSFWWIPDPASGAVSIGWEGPDGRLTTGIYNSAYVGTAASALAAMFLTLIGFYLVAGSVRRDEDTRVGAILAATPLSKTAYLLGKLVAHIVYLGALGAVSIAAAVAVFARYGVGPFRPGDFLWPFLLLVVPALSFTAACAVLFDAVRFLRRKAGLVLYFFFWTFVFFGLPILLTGGFENRKAGDAPPLFDPAGVVALSQSILDSVPGSRVEGISMGVIIPAEPPVRVEWAGVVPTARLVIARSASIVWIAAVLGLAIALFDRFERGRLPSGGEGKRFRKAKRETSPHDAPAAQAAHPVLSPIVTMPGFTRSVRAEVTLLWKEAAWLRWPLLAAAILAAAPLKFGHPGMAAFLLLLAPALAESAVREKIAGTARLVLSQPGIPRSVLAWKAAAALAFVLLLAAPSLVSNAFASPVRGASYLAGLCFVAVFATAAGSLTGGGKLFLGAYLALWYVAVNGGGPLDFSGVLGPVPSAAPLGFLAFALALLAAAAVLERVRAT
jgi:hypothetical protein